MRHGPVANESSQGLEILWRRRRLVGIGVAVALLAALVAVYRISVLPPSLETRTNVFATASTQILVDTPRSAFADISNELDPLENRASVFARFLTSPTAVELIGREAGLPPAAIEAQGPYDVNLPPVEQEPTAEQRSTQIVGEEALYRLRFESNPELPLVSVFAQAPTAAEAALLAEAAPAALRGYIERIQREQGTPLARQVEIRTLGAATGAVVNEGADREIAALVFIVVFAAWCLLLVPARTIVHGWPGFDDRERPPPGENGDDGRNGRERGAVLLQPRRGRRRVG